MENTEQESIIPPPPSIARDTNNYESIQEPAPKRMKVSSPSIPHYNSHNIYSHPSLPCIVDPIDPLSSDYQVNDNNDDNNNNNNTEIWPLCAYCDRSDDLSRCSICRQTYYCNRQCQVAHWNVHCIICQPGPPQPAELTNNGEPVHPPTRITHYPLTHYPLNYNEPQQAMKVKSVSSSSSNSNKYYCQECDRYFKNGQALGGHRSRVHSSRRNGGGHGGDTKRRRQSRPSRARHEATGNGQHVCPHCSRQFATGQALGGHISGAHTKKSKRASRGYHNVHDPSSSYAPPRHPML